MRLVLNIIIGLQLLLGVWWTVPLLYHDGDFSTLYVFFIAAIANGVFLLVAAWAVWKHPDLRRRAAVVMALPFALYFLPWIVKGVFGGPLTGDRGKTALILLGAAVLVACLFFPKRVFRLLPSSFVQSRFLNWLLIIGMLSAWLFPIVVIIWLGSSDSGGSSSGTAVAYAVFYFALYIVVVGGAALAMMLWAWIGLRSGAENPSRKLHIAQLVMGSPSLIIGVLTLGWLASQQ